MRSKIGNLLIVTILLGFCLFCITPVLAEPVVEQVVIDPEEPAPKSTVNITTMISSDEDISDVHLLVQECKANLCFQRENVTMSLVDDEYSYEYELSFDDATYFKYNFNILSGGKWYETQITNVTLKEESDGNNNGGTDDNGGGTPGFELVSLFIAVSLGVLLFKRKRVR